MLLLRLSAVAMIVAGVAMFVAGQSSDEAGGALAVTAIVLVACGVGMLVLAQLLAPIMRSSKEMTERRGMKVGRLTGAPTMRSSMAVASRQMAAAQQAMDGLMGTGHIQAHGIPGMATVKAARDTGRKQNMNPVFEVDLVVMPNDGRSYDATIQTEVNTLAVAQCVPGTQVSVKADPNNPQNVWIDWLAVAGT